MQFGLKEKSETSTLKMEAQNVVLQSLVSVNPLGGRDDRRGDVAEKGIERKEKRKMSRNSVVASIVVNYRLMGLSKADVFARLYNASKPVGMGIIHHVPGGLAVGEAEIVLFTMGTDKMIDYYNGRPLKIDLRPDDTVDLALYDHYHGEGAGLRALRKEDK